jgi:outer membrane lipoprotein carrier protein
MKISRLMYFFGFLLLLPAAALGAAPTGLSDVIATLEQGYASLRDVQASFSQRTEVASVGRAQTGSGELFIKKPAAGGAMFRFDYAKPSQQIVSDGRTVWYYVPENRQVMVMETSALHEAGGGVALSYLTGIGNVSRDFSVKLVGEGRDGKGNYLIELVPKKPGQAFAKLRLTVAAKAVEAYLAEGKASVPFPIVSSVVFDQMGNRTTFEFRNVKANRGVNASRFTFRIPVGVEVIRTPGGGKK